MKEGDSLIATDLQGVCYRSEITSISKLSKDDWEARCSIFEKLPNYNESPKHIHLVIGILQQASKFEEVLEKCTELGVKEFTPLTSSRSEKEDINVERSERILRSATKQVSRSTKPVLNPKESLESVLSELGEKRYQIITFHEQPDIQESFTTSNIDSSPTALLIGPEGGFTDDEIALAKSFGAKVLSLGSRRLRAETAAIAACAIALA
jgi:16S rRNA (uracil1498-N3)-methyltransferase